MFAGFNLKTEQNFDTFYPIGKNAFDTTSKKLQNQLDFYTENGIIDGTKLQNDWFPEIEADIFISHSHNDKELAIGFAGWLKETFGITSFIDSCVWGYSNDLLKKIDDKYCYQTNTYNYEKRNYSTSHVHIILSTSLYKMIDKVESVFLLNTENSILSVKNTVDNEVFSPWIYSEIIATEIVRKKKLSEYRKKENIMVNYANVSANAEKNLKISYDVSLEHLYLIDDRTINQWQNTWNNLPLQHKNYALNPLYEIVDPSKFKPLIAMGCM